MSICLGIAGFVMVSVILWDAFETIILPRRVTRKFRLARYFYRVTWKLWSALSRLLSDIKHRDSFLSFFGPLSLLGLLTTWALGLVFSFGLLHWAADAPFIAMDGMRNFSRYIYLSGTTFFTLGIGDVTPHTVWDRVVTVAEAGVGFGFLAIVIGYLPVIYQAFSRREVNISLLDARAGSPPSAARLLRGHNHDHGMDALMQLLRDWEHWSAELMESHLSYPVLAYFRSQHSNQSWLAALTAILDTSALVMVGVEGACERQAELTFAIARHAVVDLAQVFAAPPSQTEKDRLPPEELARLRKHLSEGGLLLRQGPEVDQKLLRLRRMYEPYVQSLSHFLALALPPWMIQAAPKDNWQTSAWEKLPDQPGARVERSSEEEHF